MHQGMPKLMNSSRIKMTRDTILFAFWMYSKEQLPIGEDSERQDVPALTGTQLEHTGARGHMPLAARTRNAKCMAIAYPLRAG
eukprot:13860442-Alexandrium_andersonii.AAC.2